MVQKRVAQLEGSKDFAKSFMENRIPTAKSASFKQDQLEDALQYLTKSKSPYVLKADGLAAGKGVIIENDLKKTEKH